MCGRAVEMTCSGQSHTGVVYWHHEKYGIGDQIRFLKELAETMTVEETIESDHLLVNTPDIKAQRPITQALRLTTFAQMPSLFSISRYVIRNAVPKSLELLGRIKC